MFQRYERKAGYIVYFKAIIAYFFKLVMLNSLFRHAYIKIRGLALRAIPTTQPSYYIIQKMLNIIYLPCDLFSAFLWVTIRKITFLTLRIMKRGRVDK